MQRVWLERRKWPDAPHYGHDGWIIGEDEHGVWLHLKAGQPIYRGTKVLFRSTGDWLACAPRSGAWLATFPSPPDPLELYVDIVTGLEHTPSAITMVDMDLDVVRLRSGEVALWDEDEFALHRVELGYPDDLAGRAVAEAQRVLAAVRRGDAPFDGAAARTWFAAARQLTSG